MEAHAPNFGATATPRATHRLISVSPMLAALAYPFVVQVFHGAVSAPAPTAVDRLLAVVSLAAALATPVYALLVARWLGRAERPVRWMVRARELAFASVAAPPFFVLVGVVLGQLNAPFRDTTAWLVVWLAALVLAASAGNADASVAPPAPSRWRVAHGVSAAVLAVYAMFHLSNHLAGLLGPDTHAAIMEAGRRVYRAAWIEPILIGLLLFQVASGVWLTRRWRASPITVQQAVQMASGVYLAAFILTHLNSALVSARWMRGRETDWAWASGAPEGLLMDSWNIRLLPHYLFGVFFILAHLATGLRHILIAHGTTARTANALWAAGLAAAAAIAATIIGALVGLRL